MKKVITMTISVMLVAVLIAACGPAGGGGGAPAADAPAAADDAPAAADAPAPDTEQEPIVLRWSFWVHAEDIGTWQDGMDAFTAMHPHVTFEIEGAAWGMYWDRLQTQVLAGTQPDVMGMVTMQSQHYMLSGALLNLQPFIDNDPDFDLYDFWPANMYAYKLNGDIHALPYDLSQDVMLLNLDLFDQAGVPHPPATGWTFDEFREASLALRDAGIHASGWQPGGHGFFNVALSTGNDIITEDGTRLLLDAPEVIDAVQRLADLLLVDEAAVPAAQVGELGMFEAGLVAMRLVNPEWVMVMRQRMPDANLDVVPLPTFGPARSIAQSLVGGAFAGGSNTNYPDIVWEFLKVYTSAEILRETVADTHRGIPGRMSIKDYMIDSQWAVPNSSLFFESIPYARWISFNNDHQIHTIMGQYLENVFLGELTAEEALTAFVEEANQILAGN